MPAVRARCLRRSCSSDSRRAPHAICLLLIYLVLRARLNNFIQVDTREREAVALRRALAVLEEGRPAAV